MLMNSMAVWVDRALSLTGLPNHCIEAGSFVNICHYFVLDRVALDAIGEGDYILALYSSKQYEQLLP